MRRGTVVLIAAIALSGCFGGGDRDRPGGTTTPAPDPAAPRFSPETYLPDSEELSEPGIKVAPDGTLYVNAPGGSSPTPVDPLVVSGDTLWRSTDGGASFQLLPTPGAFGGGDSDVAIGPDGTVYQSGLWQGCNSLSVSKDRGQTWRTNPLACGYTAVAHDRNWIAVHGTTVYVTFGWSGGPQGEDRISLLKTVASDPPVVAGTLTYADNYQWPGNVAVDPTSGAVYVVYNTVDDEIVLLRSLDGAQTLEKKTVSRRPGDTFDSFVVATVGRDGTLYVAWSERDRPNGIQPKRTDVFYAASRDRGERWSDPVRLNEGDGTHIFPWIDAGEAGHLVAAWYGTDTGGHTAEGIDGAWHVRYAESRDASSPAPTFHRAVASKQITQGSMCTSGTGCAQGTRDFLDFFQVALDMDGAAHLAWATRAWSADGAGDVRVAHAKQLTP